MSEIPAYLYRGHAGISSPTEARKFLRIIAKPNFPSLDSSTIFNLKLHVVQIREKIVFFRPFKEKRNNKELPVAVWSTSKSIKQWKGGDLLMTEES